MKAPTSQGSSNVWHTSCVSIDQHFFSLFAESSVVWGRYGAGGQGGGDGHLGLLTSPPLLCQSASRLSEEGPAKGDSSSPCLPPSPPAGDPAAAQLTKVSAHSQASRTPGNNSDSTDFEFCWLCLVTSFFVEADRIQYCGNQRASYRWIHEPLQKTQLIGTGSLRLQSEQAGSAGQSRRRVDTGQLHWQEVPPRHRQHRASVRGLPHLIARCYF